MRKTVKKKYPTGGKIDNVARAQSALDNAASNAGNNPGDPNNPITANKDIFDEFHRIITSYNDPTKANDDLQSLISKKYSDRFPDNPITGVMGLLSSEEGRSVIEGYPDVRTKSNLSLVKSSNDKGETTYSFEPRSKAPNPLAEWASPIVPGKARMQRVETSEVDNVIGAIGGRRSTMIGSKEKVKSPEQRQAEIDAIRNQNQLDKENWLNERMNQPVVMESGGWLSRNAGNLLQTVGGAALVATGVGVPAGVGMMASGAAGMVGDHMANKQVAPQVNNPNEGINDWVINRRQLDLNSRPMKQSVMLATGGRVVPGGELVPEASNAVVARGNSHEQGGIQLPGAEVENNETIVQSPFTGETQVHSDMLGYADETNQLADMKGQLESQLAEKMKFLEALNVEVEKINQNVELERDKFKRNAYSRELDKVAKRYAAVEFEAASIQNKIGEIDANIEQIFQQQEQQAAAMGMRDESGQTIQQFSAGGKWDTVNKGVQLATAGANMMGPITEDAWMMQNPLPGTNSDETTRAKSTGVGEAVNAAIPFISNVYNAYASRQLDKIDAPQAKMLATPTMDANYNINPQLESMESANRASQEFIQGNVTNANVARNAASAGNVATTRARNELYGQQSNIERQIVNQNLGMAAQIAGQNIQSDFINQSTRQQKEIAGIERRSANIANVSDKLMQMATQKNALSFQDKQLAINALQFEGTSIPIEVDLILGKFKDEADLLATFEASGLNPNSAKAKQLLARFKSINTK